MSTLVCGFIRPELIEALDSGGPETRLVAAETINESLGVITLRPNDLNDLITFSMQYFLDLNEDLVLAFCRIVDDALSSVPSEYLNDITENFLTLCITPLGDERPNVREEVSLLVLHFIEVTHSASFLQLLISFFPTQPVSTGIEIIKIAAMSIRAFPRSKLFEESILDLLNSSMTSDNPEVYNSIVALLVQANRSGCISIDKLPTTVASHFSSSITTQPITEPSSICEPNLIYEPNVLEPSGPYRAMHGNSRPKIVRPTQKARPSSLTIPNQQQDPDVQELRDKYQPPANPRPPSAPRSPRFRRV